MNVIRYDTFNILSVLYGLRRLNNIGLNKYSEKVFHLVELSTKSDCNILESRQCRIKKTGCNKFYSKEYQKDFSKR